MRVYPLPPECPKCRAGWVQTKYIDRGVGVQDMLQHRCSACGHIWWEPPLDRKERSDE